MVETDGGSAKRYIEHSGLMPQFVQASHRLDGQQLTKTHVAEGGRDRHMANAWDAAFQMNQDSACQMIAIKAVLNHKTGFGDKGAKASFLNSSCLSAPTGDIRVKIIWPIRISAQQEQAD